MGWSPSTAPTTTSPSRSTGPRCSTPSPPGSARRWPIDVRLGDLREVSVRRKVLHHPTGREDLLRERRERTDRRVAARCAQDRVRHVERDLVAVLRERERVGGFDDGDAEVAAIAEEDAGAVLP